MASATCYLFGHIYEIEANNHYSVKYCGFGKKKKKITHPLFLREKKKSKELAEYTRFLISMMFIFVYWLITVYVKKKSLFLYSGVRAADVADLI